MYREISNLILFRTVGEDSILFRLADLCKKFDEGTQSKETLTAALLTQVNRLLDLGTRYGFDQNLWHNYLAFLLVMTENPFTLVSEKVGAVNGSVRGFAENDFAIFRRLFDFDFSPLEKALGVTCFSTLQHYQAVQKTEYLCNKNVSEKVQALSAAIEQTTTAQQMYQVVTAFYAQYGMGKFGLNKAFRINPSGLEKGELLLPITNTSPVQLEDLIGYESQKQALERNTKAFVAGHEANNVLLYGDAGTGKSTSIKAILNRYYDQGLRLIEVYKHEFQYLPQVIAQIKNRNYRFVLYMDDLSFEEFEIEYKYLKAVIEGGLETRPENVLIYATSNRRHLIRETWNDRSDTSNDEMHRSETMQEKLSLVSRFGVSIGYFKPNRQEYLNIVYSLAAKHPEINLSKEELTDLANRWELREGGLSGRSAHQFITDLCSSCEQKSKL